MAVVTWLPTEEGTHAVVMGDLVTLCGEPGFLRSTTPEPGPNVCVKCAELVLAMAVALGMVPSQGTLTSASPSCGSKTYNGKCQCDACRAAALRCAREKEKGEQEASVAGAHHRGMVWTGPELETALRSDLTAREAAAVLGRTVESVKWARKRSNRDPKFARLAGVADHG